MSQRRTTVPPTRKHPPSSSSERKGLIATGKPKKQSARKRGRDPPLTIAFIERSFTQPPRAFTTQRRDATRRAGRAAEAAGRRTARGRLL